MLFVKFDMFNAKWAATYGVRLVFVFLVASSQRQLVDEVQGDGPLSNFHLLRF